MMGGTYERTVQVWDHPPVISVYQKSKSVWIALGDYMGQRVEVKGSSLTSATKHWAGHALEGSAMRPARLGPKGLSLCTRE